MAYSQRRSPERISFFALMAASILALSYIVVFETLDFVPLVSQPRSGLDWIRSDLFGMFFPLIWPVVVAAFEIGFLLFGVVALFRRRIKRAISFVGACLIVPTVWFAVPRLTICNPYYWYVLFNQSALERESKVLVQSDGSVPVILESKDVSFGLISTATFNSLVYDEVDGLHDNPAAMDRLLKAVGRDGYFEGASLAVRPLRGHFYLVTATY